MIPSAVRVGSIRRSHCSHRQHSTFTWRHVLLTYAEMDVIDSYCASGREALENRAAPTRNHIPIGTEKITRDNGMPNLVIVCIVEDDIGYGQAGIAMPVLRNHRQIVDARGIRRRKPMSS